MDINIRKIAELSALEIEESQYSVFEKQFKEIVNMVSELPVYNDGTIMPDVMELRDDQHVKSDIAQEELLKNAAETCNSCFAVPKTVEY